MAERIKGCARDGDFSDAVAGTRAEGYKSAICNASIFWALQVNAPGVVFWMIYYIYSTPGLLAEIRAEIDPYVRVAKPAGGFPAGITEKPRLEIDAAGLRTGSKLLEGVVREVLRMETFSMTYKKVSEDFTITESPEDATIYGRPGKPKTYLIQKDDFVCIPHTIHQYDARYFENPNTFDARRFWVNKHPEDSKTKTNSGDPEKPLSDALSTQDVEVSYRTTHPWGGGAQLCKGKKFAESEVVLFAAAVVSRWDFAPVDRWGRRQSKWEHPGWFSQTATAKPTREVWVQVRRREM